ncbi:hypothetical protein [Streptomyces javensis]|uniref:Uncharacterized protein n=1 Tax=Streptomyces javensis TaxID=114698 RepID=A0ABP4HU61_9ACTN
MTLQPADTRYASYRFRSRLEARWAVFFDALGIRWEYEPQSFELLPLTEAVQQRLREEQFRDPQPEDAIPLGDFLPSFWLPAQAAWFQVAATQPTEAGWARFFRFCDLSDQRAFVAVGPLPDPRTVEEHGHPQEDGFEIHTYGDQHYAWTRCRWCGFYDLAFDARSARTLCGCHKSRHPDLDAPCCNGDKCYRGDAPEILAAYGAARAARFENDPSGC